MAWYCRLRRPRVPHQCAAAGLLSRCRAAARALRAARDVVRSDASGRRRHGGDARRQPRHQGTGRLHRCGARDRRVSRRRHGHRAEQWGGGQLLTPPHACAGDGWWQWRGRDCPGACAGGAEGTQTRAEEGERTAPCAPGPPSCLPRPFRSRRPTRTAPRPLQTAARDCSTRSRTRRPGAAAGCWAPTRQRCGPRGGEASLRGMAACTTPSSSLPLAPPSGGGWRRASGALCGPHRCWLHRPGHVPRRQPRALRGRLLLVVERRQQQQQPQHWRHRRHRSGRLRRPRALLPRRGGAPVLLQRQQPCEAPRPAQEAGAGAGRRRAAPAAAAGAFGSACGGGAVLSAECGGGGGGARR